MQHLDFLSQDDKDVYKTAFEIDQRWVVELAADRTPDICQSQSLNIFLPGDVDKWDLHMLHWQAWERGCKSLYYLRSKSVQRAAHAGRRGAWRRSTCRARPRPTTRNAWPASRRTTAAEFRHGQDRICSRQGLAA